MNSIEKKRINYFDLAKGIGIILVIMGHFLGFELTAGEKPVVQKVLYWIVSFHMPMFFIISGMLIHMLHEEDRDIKTIISHKWNRMMIPYFWFSALYIVLSFAMLFSGYLRTHQFDPATLSTFYLNTWQSICLYGYSVLWFLPAIYFGEIIFLFLRKHFSITHTAVIVVVLTVFMYGCSQGISYLNTIYGTNTFFSMLYYFLVMLIRCFFSMSFIAVGYYLFYLIKSRSGFSFIELAAGVLLLIVNLLISQINGSVDIHFLVFGNIFLYFLGAITGSMAVILICKSMEPISFWIPCRILCYYGKNSLVVMATHLDASVLSASIWIASIISSHITHAKSYVFCLCVMLFVLIMEIFLIEVINRFLPFVLGQKKKSKS